MHKNLLKGLGILGTVAAIGGIAKVTYDIVKAKKELNDEIEDEDDDEFDNEEDDYDDLDFDYDENEKNAKEVFEDGLNIEIEFYDKSKDEHYKEKITNNIVNDFPKHIDIEDEQIPGQMSLDECYPDAFDTTKASETNDILKGLKNKRSEIINERKVLYEKYSANELSKEEYDTKVKNLGKEEFLLNRKIAAAKHNN